LFLVSLLDFEIIGQVVVPCVQLLFSIITDVGPVACRKMQLKLPLSVADKVLIREGKCLVVEIPNFEWEGIIRTKKATKLSIDERWAICLQKVYIVYPSHTQVSVMEAVNMMFEFIVPIFYSSCVVVHIILLRLLLI